MAVLKSALRVGALALLAGSLLSSVLAADRSGLLRVRASGFQEAYAQGGTIPTGFKEIYVAPVGVAPGSRELQELSERDRKTMEDFLGDALKDSLGRRFTLGQPSRPRRADGASRLHRPRKQSPHQRPDAEAPRH